MCGALEQDAQVERFVAEVHGNTKLNFRHTRITFCYAVVQVSDLSVAIYVNILYIAGQYGAPFLKTGTIVHFVEVVGFFLAIDEPIELVNKWLTHRLACSILPVESSQ